MSEPKNAAIVGDDFTLDAGAGAGSVSLVPLWTADEVERDLGRIDFIKIDAEGAEVDIIAGLRPVLARHRPHLILEFNAARYQNPRAFLSEVCSFYPSLAHVDFSGGIVPVQADVVLSQDTGEDWLLYFAAANGKSS